MKFIIEKNVPLPSQRSGITADLTDTMKELSPGDSFLVLYNKTRPQKSLQTAFQYVRKKLKDRKFTSASQKEDPGKTSPGLRIWRLPMPATKTSPQPASPPN
jgi:hypothetical protein